MRSPVVIIFARAPRLGAVKRRLTAGIGARGALRFYRAMLAATAWPIARDRRWRTVLAITPRGARADWAKLARPGTPRLAQVSGDLGRRMERALAPFPRAILIGSDIPGLGPDDIAAGFRALGRADAVFGPALDGGYWLVGFGPRRPHKPFANVRWSSRHALTDTLANFRHHRVALLPPSAMWIALRIWPRSACPRLFRQGHRPFCALEISLSQFDGNLRQPTYAFIGRSQMEPTSTGSDDSARECRQRVAAHLQDLHRIHLALAEDSRALKRFTTEGNARVELELAAEMLELYMASSSAFLENMRGRFEARLPLLRRGEPAFGQHPERAPEHGSFWLSFSRLCAALRRATKQVEA